MSVATGVKPQKLGWIAAARRFFYNKGERAKFGKAALALAATLRTIGFGGSLVTLLDNAAVVVPGGIVSVLDDGVWIAFGCYAFIRIAKIRWDANHTTATY